MLEATVEHNHSHNHSHNYKKENYIYKTLILTYARVRVWVRDSKEK